MLCAVSEAAEEDGGNEEAAPDEDAAGRQHDHRPHMGTGLLCGVQGAGEVLREEMDEL